MAQASESQGPDNEHGFFSIIRQLSGQALLAPAGQRSAAVACDSVMASRPGQHYRCPVHWRVDHWRLVRGGLDPLGPGSVRCPGTLAVDAGPGAWWSGAQITPVTWRHVYTISAQGPGLGFSYKQA